MEDKKLKVKGKIRALLNKTVENGASEEEAMLALKKANELMLENFLCERDLEGVAPEKIIEVREPIVVSSYDFSWFYGDLARLFDCECFWTTGRKGDIVFFGFESDAKLAMYFYQMIMKLAFSSIEEYKNSFEFIHAKSFYRTHGRTLVASFVKGFTIRLGERLTEMYQQRKASIPYGMGLMVIQKDEEVKSEFKKQHPKLKVHKVNLDNLEEAAFRSGQEKSKEVDLVQPLNGSTENLMQLSM
ncbi:DUF2786 domain-containing protein [Myroides odoratus]|uniref:DUF2786 domain-containing protein n=1 Tax=Myroides odoratus TaxID=256 RepID=UPI0007659EC7|nr:DUF2786 domain-containing protein [Myroides odoratus]